MPTAADLMTAAVPRASPNDTAGSALAAVRTGRPQEAGHVYLLDASSRLVGQVPIETLITVEPDTPLHKLKGEPPVEVHPEDSAETVALLAVERHDADVAVIDGARKLLGAIPIGRLLALLHEEHVDDLLRLGGVGTAHPVPTHMDGTFMAFRARMPWLMLGLAGGMLAGGVARLFEASLQREIALVVAITLAVTAVVATLVASLLPLGLARLGADPALASGPIATVCQDVLSVAVYLGIATLML
jgi:magnesium transporter